MNIQGTTFYEQIQNCSALDLRDTHVKRHSIALILLDLFPKGDGDLSVMPNKHTETCSVLGLKETPVISRSQLPIVLKKVDLSSFDNLLFSNFGIT